jgi:hypothetical protein
MLLGMIPVSQFSGIRKPEKFFAARQKEEQKRQHLIKTVYENIVPIINEKHDGKLRARTDVEVLELLIRDGVFGASSKFPLRVARDRKVEHHKNISQLSPTEIPEEYRRWYALVLQGLNRCEQEGKITTEWESEGLVINTGHTPEQSDLLKDLEERFGKVVETPDVDHDAKYHPLDHLNARLLNQVGRQEAMAY